MVYLDHVLFKNADPSLYRPSIREVVGWIEKENEEALWIVWERPVTRQPHEKVSQEQSGLVILKSNIMEMKTVA